MQIETIALWKYAHKSMTEIHNFQSVALAAFTTYVYTWTFERKQVSQVLPRIFCYIIVGSVLADRQRHVETEDYSVSLDIYQAHRVTKVSSAANE
jgi:hypothetical protein